MKSTQRSELLLTVAVSASILVGCSPGPSESSYREAQPPEECRSVLNTTMKYMRAGEYSDRAKQGVELLAEHCPAEIDIFTDYAASSDMLFGPVSCELVAERAHPEAVMMLREDGHCEDTPAAASWPDGGLGWDSASEHAGTYQRVCGPLTSIRNTYDGAFVNVGRDYPDSGRFTFILWGYELQPLPAAATVCASGNIYMYEGMTAQMELGSPEQLEIWD